MSGWLGLLCQVSTRVERAQGLSGNVIVRLAVIVVLAVLAGIGLRWALRWWLRDSDPAPAGDAGFTLADLRAMHARGELDDTEFEAMKAIHIGQAREGLQRAADASDKPAYHFHVEPADAAVAGGDPAGDPGGDPGEAAGEGSQPFPNDR